MLPKIIEASLKLARMEESAVLPSHFRQAERYAELLARLIFKEATPCKRN